MRAFRVLMVMAVIVCAVFAAYWSVRHHAFVMLDDPIYLTDNLRVQQGLTGDNVAWAFTTFETGNWHPLTWLSLMLDWQWFGEDAGRHHLNNVVLHAFNALLMLWMLWLLTGGFWPSAAAALLWAVHPLRVESVAWAAERKDLLAGMFGLACIALYVLYVRKPGVTRYLLVAISMSLSLMCKPMIVTWPFLLLLLDFWPLRRARPPEEMHDTQQASVQRLILEKLPLVGLAIASSVVTIAAQRASGAVANLEDLPLGARLANAAVSCARYLGSMFAPIDLAAFYPLEPKWPTLSVIGAVALLVLITFACVSLRRRMPWLLCGWLWFLGTLTPVIGIVQVGSQAMADRYTYLPQIGIVMAVVWTLWSLLKDQIGAMVCATLILTALLLMQTQQQVAHWRDTETLYERTLKVTRDNWVIENNSGALAMARGDLARAEQHYREVVRIHPDSAAALASLAESLARQGAFTESILLFRRSVDLNPDDLPVSNNLAWLLAMVPTPSLRSPLEALQLAERVCANTDPESPEFASHLDTLATAQAANGRYTEATETARRAMNLAMSRGMNELAQQIGQRLQMYQQAGSLH